MKKILSFFIILSFCCNAIYAHYVQHEPHLLTQPNGVEINCFITGDEYYRRVYDEQGFTITRNKETGYFVYALLVNDELVATSYVVGEVDPASVGLTPNVDISAAKKQERREQHLSIVPEREQSRTGTGPRTGTMTNVVIYISFPDGSFTHTKNSIEDLFTSPARGASLYSYYRDISNGNFTFNSDFFPYTAGNTILSYVAPQPRSYYEIDNEYPGQGSTIEWQLLYDAVNYCKSAIQATISAAELDVDGDGYVDNVIFVVQGAPGPWSTLLWPHKWSLYNGGNLAELHGRGVWSYNLIIENHLFTASNGQQSVLVHECYHTLGAPDLYRYTNNDITPVGSWDVMASNTLPPQSSSSHITRKYGEFIEEIPTITTSGTYTIYDIWNRTPGQNISYKLLSPKSTIEEFYVLDYRKSSGEIYESKLGNGIVIERINSSIKGNASGPPDEVYVFRKNASDNQTNGDYSTVSSVFYSAEYDRTAFNSTSNPPCFLANNTIDAISISQIGSTGGAFMTFQVDIGIYPDFSTNGDTIAGALIAFTNATTTVNPDKTTYYEWNFGDGTPISTQINPSHTYTTEGAYTVTLKAETEWGYMIITKSINVISDVNITVYPVDDYFTLYPNPSTGKFYLEFKEPGRKEIKIFDMLGRIIYNENSEEEKIELELSHSGIYIVDIDNRIQKQVIIQK